MFGHGQRNWALDMILTLANPTHILKASLLSDKTSQTISLHQLLMKIIHSGMFVLNSADQKIIWIGFIVDIQNIFHLLHFYMYVHCTLGLLYLPILNYETFRNLLFVLIWSKLVKDRKTNSFVHFWEKLRLNNFDSRSTDLQQGLEHQNRKMPI